MATDCDSTVIRQTRHRVERTPPNWRTIISDGSESSITGRLTEGLGENDHDLLTCAEAAARLHAETNRAAERVAQLLAADDTEGAAQARQRLAALQVAARRIDDHRVNDANFEKFFGHPARREVGGPPTA
jgi:hypothetical protein